MTLNACTVDLPAALDWFNHKLSDCELLLASRPGPLAAFVYHLEGLEGWRLLARRQDIWSCSLLVCRSVVPGVRRALEWAGAIEQGPDHRFLLEQVAMVSFQGRLVRLLSQGEQRKRTLPGLRSPGLCNV